MRARYRFILVLIFSFLILIQKTLNLYPNTRFILLIKLPVLRVAGSYFLSI